MSKTVILVDDDVDVLSSLAGLIDALGFDTITYSSGDALLEQCSDVAGKMIFLDIRMPGRDGMETLRELRAKSKTTHIVMMTGHGDVPLAVQAMKDGANDFLEKPFSVEQIQAVLERSAPQEKVVDPLAVLTPRETDVAKHLSDGLANKQVAYQLGISVRTVEVHRARLLSKLGITSIAELVRLQLSK